MLRSLATSVHCMSHGQLVLGLACVAPGPPHAEKHASGSALEVHLGERICQQPVQGPGGMACAHHRTASTSAGTSLRALNLCSSAVVQTRLTSTAMSTPATTVASARRGRCRTASRGRGTARPTSMGMPTRTRSGRRPLRPTALASEALSTHAGRPSTPRGGRTSSRLLHAAAPYPLGPWGGLWPVACQPYA